MSVRPTTPEITLPDARWRQKSNLVPCLRKLFWNCSRTRIQVLLSRLWDRVFCGISNLVNISECSLVMYPASRTKKFTAYKYLEPLLWLIKPLFELCLPDRSSCCASHYNFRQVTRLMTNSQQRNFKFTQTHQIPNMYQLVGAFAVQLY